MYSNISQQWYFHKTLFPKRQTSVFCVTRVTHVHINGHSVKFRFENDSWTKFIFTAMGTKANPCPLTNNVYRKFAINLSAFLVCYNLIVHKHWYTFLSVRIVNDFYDMNFPATYYYKCYISTYASPLSNTAQHYKNTGYGYPLNTKIRGI